MANDELSKLIETLLKNCTDEDPYIVRENNPCVHCPNNPQNGGSGICHCILGQQTIY